MTWQHAQALTQVNTACVSTTWFVASLCAGSVTVLLDMDSRHHGPDALDGDKRPTYVVRSLQVGVHLEIACCWKSQAVLQAHLLPT
jgi:hypothetical protein